MKYKIGWLATAWVLFFAVSCAKEEVAVVEQEEDIIVQTIVMALGSSEAVETRGIVSEIPEEFFYPFDYIYFFNHNSYYEMEVYSNENGQKYISFELSYRKNGKKFTIKATGDSKGLEGHVGSMSFFSYAKDNHYNSMPTKLDEQTPDGKKLLEVHGPDHYRTDAFYPTIVDGNLIFLEQTLPTQELITTLEVPMNRLTACLMPQLAIFKGSDVQGITAEEYTAVFGTTRAPEIHSYLYNYGTKFWLREGEPVEMDNNDYKGYYELTSAPMTFAMDVPVTYIEEGKSDRTINTVASEIGSEGYAYLFAIPCGGETSLDMFVYYGDNQYVWLTLPLKGKTLSPNERKAITIYADIDELKAKSGVLETRSGGNIVAVPMEEVDFAGGNVPPVFFSW